MQNLKFKELREKKGMIQLDVARVLQIDRTTYGRHETGERRMTYESLVRLADFYDCSIDFLLGRVEGDCVVLSTQEAELIAKFRQTDGRGQEALLAMANYESNRKKQSKFGGFA